MSILNSHSVTLPAFFGVFLLGAACLAEPTINSVETFDVDVSGWEDRDANELQIQFEPFGNPGGAISGVSSNLLVPIPETDAMRAGSLASTGIFTGNYAQIYGVIAGWVFEFNARTVLPSSAFLRMGRGTNIFYQSFTDQISAPGVWTPVFVPLDTVSDWLGGDAAAFTNVLGNVDFVEIQITRRGAEAQTYSMDNFALFELIPGTGSPPSREGNSFRITWDGLKTDFEYNIEASTNLNQTLGWTNITSFIATNVLTDWTMPFDTNNLHRFYRIRLTEIPLQ